MNATVVKINKRGFAFLAIDGQPDGDEIFAHRNSFPKSCNFDTLLGIRVSCETAMTPKGPVATMVVILPAIEQDRGRDHGFIESMAETHGWLIPDVGGRLFCHRDELAAGQAWPENLAGCRVTYTLAIGKRGAKAVALRMEDSDRIPQIE